MAESPLRISMFGRLRVQDGDRCITRFRTQKTAALLAYLAFHPQRLHTREELAGILWPDSDPVAGRASIRTAIASLRQQLQPSNALSERVFISDRVQIGLDPSIYTTDVGDFLALLRAAQSSSADAGARRREQTQAVELYAGELLPGHYEDWILPEREHLLQQYVATLHQLTDADLERGDYQSALRYGRLWTRGDRWNEEAYITLMRVMDAAGMRADVVRQYRALELLLREEFDAEPSRVAQLLFEKAGGSLLLGKSLVGSSPTPGSLPAAPQSLPSALRRPPACRRGLRLPTPLTQFFGRHTEISDMADMLAGRTGPSRTGGANFAKARLITITGAGGTGKTRLALEVAARLVEAFSGGVVFVALADVTDPLRLIEAIAKALQVVIEAGNDPVVQVAEAVRDHATLFVLDNFEQLIAPEPDDPHPSHHDLAPRLIHELLTRVPSLCCLITSRRRLDIDGEWDYTLSPLPTPQFVASPERLLDFACVELFVNRAQARRSDFHLSAHNAEVVGELCRRLEGIPLAIELAAGWADTLTPAQMLQRLTRRLDLLAGKRNGVPARHQTMRAALQWSYQQLSPDLQDFFACCCVFQSGWTVEGAEAVASGVAGLEVLRQLQARSLVIADVVQLPGMDQMRWRMLETVRDFGWEQIDEENRDQVARRHAQYYGRFVGEATAHLGESSQALWLDRLECERLNISAALRWCAYPSGDPELGVRMAGRLRQFWGVRGHHGVGRELIDQLIVRADKGESTRWLADGYRTAGALAAYQHDWTAAVRHHQECLRMERAIQNNMEIANSLYDLGDLALRENDYALAGAYLNESLSFYRAAGSALGVAAVTGAQASILAEQHDYAGAVTLYASVVDIQRQIGNLGGIAHWLKYLGLTYLAQGDHNSACACLDEAFGVYIELGDARGIAESLCEIAVRLPISFEAVRLFGAVQALYATTTAAPFDISAEIANMRDMLGDMAFDAALAEGRALTMQRAIADAMALLTQKVGSPDSQ